MNRSDYRSQFTQVTSSQQPQQQNFGFRNRQLQQNREDSDKQLPQFIFGSSSNRFPQYTGPQRMKSPVNDFTRGHLPQQRSEDAASSSHSKDIQKDPYGGPFSQDPYENISLPSTPSQQSPSQNTPVNTTPVDISTQIESISFGNLHFPLLPLGDPRSFRPLEQITDPQQRALLDAIWRASTRGALHTALNALTTYFVKIIKTPAGKGYTWYALYSGHPEKIGLYKSYMTLMRAVNSYPDVKSLYKGFYSFEEAVDKIIEHGYITWYTEPQNSNQDLSALEDELINLKQQVNNLSEENRDLDDNISLMEDINYQQEHQIIDLTEENKKMKNLFEQTKFVNPFPAHPFQKFKNFMTLKEQYRTKFLDTLEELSKTKGKNPFKPTIKFGTIPTLTPRQLISSLAFGHHYDMLIEDQLYLWEVQQLLEESVANGFGYHGYGIIPAIDNRGLSPVYSHLYDHMEYFPKQILIAHINWDNQAKNYIERLFFNGMIGSIKVHVKQNLPHFFGYNCNRWINSYRSIEKDLPWLNIQVISTIPQFEGGVNYVPAYHHMILTNQLKEPDVSMMNLEEGEAWKNPIAILNRYGSKEELEDDKTTLIQILQSRPKSSAELNPTVLKGLELFTHLYTETLDYEILIQASWYTLWVPQLKAHKIRVDNLEPRISERIEVELDRKRQVIELGPPYKHTWHDGWD